jgi:hypothetical protein
VPLRGLAQTAFRGVPVIRIELRAGANRRIPTWRKMHYLLHFDWIIYVDTESFNSIYRSLLGQGGNFKSADAVANVLSNEDIDPGPMFE